MVRFFHHTINNFFEPSENNTVGIKQGIDLYFFFLILIFYLENVDRTNKWCIFTRTSAGELLRLHTDSKLQKLLVLPLVEMDAVMDEQDREYNGEGKYLRLFVFVFSLFHSDCGKSVLRREEA